MHAQNHLSEMSNNTFILVHRRRKVNENIITSFNPVTIHASTIMQHGCDVIQTVLEI